MLGLAPLLAKASATTQLALRASRKPPVVLTFVEARHLLLNNHYLLTPSDYAGLPLGFRGIPIRFERNEMLQDVTFVKAPSETKDAGLS